MVNQTSSLELSHFPVMLDEVIKICSPKSGGNYCDCTFGGGSYSKEILKFSNTYVHALDRDKKVIIEAQTLEKKYPERFKFYQIKFSQLDQVLSKNIDVVIFDLGLSSIQLDNLERGFSFRSKDKLDMCMGLNEISALEAINNLSEQDLRSVIKILGEEQEAYKIAKNIVKHRNINKINNTSDLVKIITLSKKKITPIKLIPVLKLFKH